MKAVAGRIQALVFGGDSLRIGLVRTGSLLAAIAVLAALVTRSARGDALEEIRHRGTLIWGGDQEGGAPYVYPDPKDPEHLIGFEVELAEMLAQELGVKAKFQQGQWDRVPQMLGNEIDIALNGFERTPERMRDYLCSRPYYMYGLQLVVRPDSPIHSWDELRAGNSDGQPYEVGVLGGTAAQTYLEHLKKDSSANITITSYDGTTDALEHVKTKVLDTTVQDECAALFYVNRDPELALVGWPVNAGYYVVLAKQGETKLLAAIDEALGKIISDGRLESLYDKWQMGGRRQTLLLRKESDTVVAETPTLANILRTDLPVLLESAGMTVLLSVVSFPLAIAIGIAIAVGRLYGPWIVAKPMGIYVEVLRGTPLMLQLYAIFFLLPKIGLALPALVAGIAGLAINYSAYEAEIYRAGLQAIPRGQMEAALALGMTPFQAIRRIILPQAFRIVIPPVTNDFIALFKDTSVCSVITIVELTKRYSILALSTGAIVQLAGITAVLYMLMSFPLSVFARWSEWRLDADATHR
ncbi:MAG TPA: ABC transporter substrate-binding protein/permease [Pirellulales bacterium]|jgi:polar amino acid transport system substrate-binding protein